MLQALARPTDLPACLLTDTPAPSFCHDTIVEFGEAALRQVAYAQQPDEAVERVIEVTVLLSGIGFESGGLSLAHALVRGFSAHAVLGKFLHGEVRVALVIADRIGAANA